MRRCEKCGCLCDPSDIVGGVCDDCREEEKRKEEVRDELFRWVEGEFRQMELEEFSK